MTMQGFTRKDQEAAISTKAIYPDEEISSVLLHNILRSISDQMSDYFFKPSPEPCRG